MITCDPSQRIVGWNHAAERLLGPPRADTLGRFCWEVLRASDPGGRRVCGSHCSRARLGAHGWPVEPQELDIQTESGRRRLVVDTLTAQHESARAVVHIFRPAASGASGALHESAPHLTARQLEILRLLGEGRRAKEIARHLCLSETTVRNHIHAVLRELDSHSQIEALSKARRLGLVA